MCDKTSKSDNGVSGRWTSLPPHGGTGRIRHVAVAMGKAGVFLAITAQDGPRVLHGRLVGDDLEWSQPWPVPVPLPRPHVEHRASWAAYGDALDGAHITIDRLDPMRIAVNLLEYQGGSHGIVVGRWNETFLHVAYPHHDSDIRFGTAMILRGPELFTHDASSFWQFRLTGASAAAQELPLHDTVDELGWHAGVDEAAQAVVLSAFSELVILKRTSAGDFQLHRRVKVPEPIADLAVSEDGHATVVLDREGAFDVLTYDSDWREHRKRTITAPELENDPQPHHAKHVTMYDSRVVLETARGFFVLDVPSGRHVRLVAPPSLGSELALVMHADNVVLASREGVGIYSVAGAL
jgi:hypothetical protein